MKTSPEPLLKPASDGYSYQVHAPSDPGFWFRLVREPDRDVITDYSVGFFPVEQAAGLLSSCYKLLGLTPRAILVFRDIPVGKREFYTLCGKSVLTNFGASEVDAYFEREARKWHLTLVAHSKPE